MLFDFPFIAPFFLALRNIRTRLGRTLLTLMGIALGVAVVLAIQITNQSTLDSLRETFNRATGQAELLVVPVNQVSGVLDEKLVARVEKTKGVNLAAPSLHVQTLLASEVRSWQLAFSVTGIAAGSILELYGIDPALDPQVRVYEISSGRMPVDEKFETIVPARFADEKKLKIGDDLVILTPERAERLEIVGLLAEDGVALLNDGAVIFAPLSVTQNLFGRRGELDEIALHLDSQLSEDPQRLEAFKQELDDRLDRDGRVIYPAARGQLVTQMLATYQQGLTFFSLIAIFVGAFLIYNTFSMTVIERTREIGMLRAIGMSRWQILRMVLAEAVLLSAVGSAFGLVGGTFLARGLIVIMGEVVSASERVFSVPWQGLVQSLAVGVGVTLGAALLPALQAARILPLDALRARAHSVQRIRPTVWLCGLVLFFVGWAALYRIQWRLEVLFGVGSVSMLAILFGATLTVPLIATILERLTRPLSHTLYGNEGALGNANVRRSIGRTTLTVASLMIAVTMVIGIGSVSYSFEKDMASWIDTALGGDLYVRSVMTMRESLGRQLETVPGVAAATPARYLQVRVAPDSLPASMEEVDSLYFVAIDPLSYRRVASMEFAAGQGDPEASWARLAQGEAVFISNVVADRFGLEQGDSLELLTHRGVRAFTVAAVVVDFTGQGLIITGSYADIHRWFAASGSDRFTVKVAPGYSLQQVADAITARFGDSRHVSVQTTKAFRDNILGLMAQSFRLFDVLNLIGLIVGALGVINTLTMNVVERQREIGGLRSLGMRRGQVLRMVLAESLAMGVIGGVYGLAFGYVLAQTMIRGINLMNGYDLEYAFAAQPYVTGVLIALGVSQLAALYPARRAARVNIVEAIKHE